MDKIIIQGESIPKTLRETLSWVGESNLHSRAVAFDYHVGRGIESYLIEGAILAKAEEEKDWELLQYNNFFEWAEHERRIKRTQAQRMLEIFRSGLHDKYMELILQIPFTNLYEAARIAKKLSEDQKVDLLHTAINTTERQFKDHTREIEGKLPTDKCLHDGKFDRFKKCCKCLKFIKED